MIRSVEFELHTLRERNQRGASMGARMALAAREKEQRQTTATTLRRTFGHPPLWHVFPEPSKPDFTRPNRIRVTLTRLSPGTLDEDGIDDALKNVRDGVADWLGLKNDRDNRLTWAYAQERSAASVHKVRIEIADLGPGDDRRVVLATETERAGGELVRVRKGRRVPVQQLELAPRRSYALLPWEQAACPACGGVGQEADSVAAVACPSCRGTGRKGRRVAHLPRFDRVPEPPETITLAVPPAHADRYAAPTITLTRRPWVSKALGECHLYEERTSTT